MTRKLNNDNGLQGREDRTPAANITYTQAGVSCLVGQESGRFKVKFLVGCSVVKIPLAYICKPFIDHIHLLKHLK